MRCDKVLWNSSEDASWGATVHTHLGTCPHVTSLFLETYRTVPYHSHAHRHMQTCIWSNQNTAGWCWSLVWIMLQSHTHTHTYYCCRIASSLVCTHSLVRLFSAVTTANHNTAAQKPQTNCLLPYNHRWPMRALRLHLVSHEWLIIVPEETELLLLSDLLITTRAFDVWNTSVLIKKMTGFLILLN